MLEFINTLGDFLAGAQAQMVYWVLALGGTGLFVVLGILALFGIGGDGAPDFDADGNFSLDHVDTGYLDFKLISFRSILAFVTVFGWGGVLWGQHGWLGFMFSLICGLVMMFLTALIFWMVLRLQQSGNVSREEFLGKTGTVYLGIPGGRTNPGKVTVTVGSSTHEILALSDEPIPTGNSVTIIETLGERRYLVEKI